MAGNKNIDVEVTAEHWTAMCDCGYSFHVQHFTMANIAFGRGRGHPPGEPRIATFRAPRRPQWAIYPLELRLRLQISGPTVSLREGSMLRAGAVELSSRSLGQSLSMSLRLFDALT